jgi:hypothetical protein
MGTLKRFSGYQAQEVTYNNSMSGLTASTTQDALDELVTAVNAGVPAAATVNTYADLPAANTVPDQFRYVKTETGSFIFFNKKQRGWYQSNGVVWLYAGDNSRLALEVAFSPNGDIAAIDVQDAIVEVRDDTDTKLSGQATAIGLKADKTITISPGTGLTGGGDLSANRTLTLANTAVTPATYGDATHVGRFTVDAQGRLTAAAAVLISAGAATGTLKGMRILTSGTSYTPTSGTTQIIATLVGGGAGGGGNGTTGVIVAGSGGGAGGSCNTGLISCGAGPFTYAIGAAGAGGVGNANGSAGGNTTLTISAAYAANGGTGGLAAGTTANARKVGSAGGTATGGAINIAGGRGKDNLHTNGTTPNSGGGGDSPYGTGGTGQYADSATSAVGFSGTGYGAGGGGSVNSATATARNGGAGTQGIIIIYEFN